MDDGEFALIERIVARLPSTEAVLLGPGDDGAVVAAPDGRVVASTDLMVDGTHFRTEWSTGYDVGRKAAAANLADIVAMGAWPTALVVGLACPADLKVAWAEALADGLREECERVGASVVGGDIVRSDTLTIAVTALGDLGGRAPVTRAGAMPGDQVVLTGTTGAAAAGLALLEAGQRDHPLADAHRYPHPAYDVAARMAVHGGATSMIDVSDGLLADLAHVARASGVRIEIQAARLAVGPEIEAAGRLLGVDPMTWALTGGDDHVFAATLPAATLPATSPSPDGVRAVGVVVALAPGQSPLVVVTDRASPAVTGHQHFHS